MNPTETKTEKKIEVNVTIGAVGVERITQAEFNLIRDTLKPLAEMFDIEIRSCVAVESE